MNDEENVSETSVLNLIQQIQSGAVNPESLNKNDRERCVEILCAEGYLLPEIAQILKRHERTIRRDLDEIRQRNAISPNLNLAKELVGEMVWLGRLRQTRLSKLARSKDISPLEKGQLEFMARKVCKEMIEGLQSLGYLPLKPHEIVGDIFHHGEGENLIKSFDEIQAIVKEVETVIQKTNHFEPEVVKEIETLNAELERARLSRKADELLKKQTQLPEETQHD